MSVGKTRKGMKKYTLDLWLTNKLARALEMEAKKENTSKTQIVLAYVLEGLVESGYK